MMLDEETGEEIPASTVAFLKAFVTPWPDLSMVKPVPREAVEMRACVRCRRSISSAVCPRCRAVQATYRP